MRARSIPVVAALAMLLLMPASASASPPVSVYHGVWTGNAVFTGTTCEPPFVAMEVSGNWNATLKPNGTGIVHIDMYATLLDDSGNVVFGPFQIDSWGGKALGDTWTVTSRSDNGFALYLHDLYGSDDTFTVAGDTATFTIAPYAFGCDSAISYGTVVRVTPAG